MSLDKSSGLSVNTSATVFGNFVATGITNLGSSMTCTGAAIFNSTLSSGDHTVNGNVLAVINQAIGSEVAVIKGVHPIYSNANIMFTLNEITSGNVESSMLLNATATGNVLKLFKLSMNSSTGCTFKIYPTLGYSFICNNIYTALTMDTGGNCSMPYNLTLSGTSSNLCLTGSSAKLGIGTSSPQAQLHVIGAVASNTMKIESLITGSDQISWVHWGTTADWYIRSGLTTGNILIQDGGGTIKLGSSGSTTNVLGNLFLSGTT